MEHELIDEIVESILESVRLVRGGDPARLLENVGPDLKVVDVETVDVAEVHEESRTVQPFDSSDLGRLDLYHLE